MARPLRIEFAGGLYHVTSRGDRREDIYFGDADRLAWIEILGAVCERFNWRSHAYCLMTNHYMSWSRWSMATRQEHAPTQRRLHAVRQSHAPTGWPRIPGALQGDPGREGRLSWN